MSVVLGLFSVPGPPSFLDVIERGLDSLTLKWGAPADNNGRLAGYTLKYQPGRLSGGLIRRVWAQLNRF